jgi:hypothetical protein
MNLVNYKKLINPILKYYISDAVNTKEKIIYKVEYHEKYTLNKDDCTNNVDFVSNNDKDIIYLMFLSV